MNNDYDKINGDVAFYEGPHKYVNVKDGGEYISVTTLIEKFGQPYDKEFWSGYKALERLIPAESWKIEKKSLLSSKKITKELLDLYEITDNDFNKAQQDILDEWEATNKEACERGTKIHAELEHSMYKMGTNVNLQRFGIGGKFTCEQGRTALDLENGVYPEYLISRTSPDGILRIAGQVDLLIKNGNHITIVDYKGLPLDTQLPTPYGWTTIRDVKVGDILYDKNGEETTILHKSEIHYNPCYKITFDNGESIVADHEHRWEVSFKISKSKTHPSGYRTEIMTTEQLAVYLENIEERASYNIPKILNPKPLNCSQKDLPIDPYVLGVWLGDGSKSCGIITQAKDSPVWEEIKRRGYEIGDNAQHNPDRTNVEMRTVYGLRTQLGKLGLINNKFIPDIYQRASFEQRLDLLRGLMDTDGYYHPKRKRFVMATGQEWQRDDLRKLLATFGIKSTIFEVTKKCEDKSFIGWDVCFSTDLFNPFLTRNQNNIEVGKIDCRTFRNIDKVELVDTIPTQCLEVDSPTHTFLCTEEMIVTHNTNKEIKLKGGFDTKTKQTVKMKYPLNNLEDCNFYHYTMQLSTYAWMLQKLNPDFVIDDLIIVHFDHEGEQHIYHLEYLKKEVERMLLFYKKQIIHEQQESKYKRIEY